MSHERQAAAAHEHGLHNHEFHDIHAEHTHEGHVCSSTCEHHQAEQYIDIMEPVMSHEHGEEHVHGPGCGHVEYQLARTEIDTPHVHDEHCGHLDHHKAAEHVDHGKEHKHNTHSEDTSHNHEKKHVHGPNCGHVEYEEAHKHVDKHVDEPATVKIAVEYAAGDAGASDDNLDIKVAATESETAQEVKASASTAPETSDVSRPDEATIARPLEQAATNDTDRVHAEDEQTSPVSETIEQMSSVEQPAIEVLDADTITPMDKTESIDPDGESGEGLMTEIPPVSVDEESIVEPVSESLFADEPFETVDTLDLMPESTAPAFDLTEGISTDTSIDFDALEETSSLQLVESSALESLSDISESDELTEELGSMTNVVSGEAQSDFSNFDTTQIVEVSGNEIEDNLETAEAYIKSLIRHANDIDPSDLEAICDELLATLQNIPKESVEELLPLLEELTELCDLPELEKLLALYFAGHYQEPAMIAQLLGSSAQGTQSITARLGQVVLELLKSSHRNTQYNAAL